MLRSNKTQGTYEKFIKDGFLADGCNLCKEPSIKEFTHWKILDNRFPWDLVAQIHHMIVPKRHIVYEELNDAEKKEFDEIKLAYIEENYELIAEATNKKKSIPEHLHIHLLVLKK